MSEFRRGELSVKALELLKEIPDETNFSVLTCPIDKKACVEAGYKYPGQTEYFTDIWQGESIMILAGPKLRVGLATNHLALNDVSANLSTDLIEKKIELLQSTLSKVLGLKSPKIGVCGLNPHASDGGLFGNEEESVIGPAIEKFSADVTGPFPADTLFHFAYNGQYDGVLAMYHDQGLGPLKTVHFYDAVNITGGLKHLRVSA